MSASVGWCGAVAAFLALAITGVSWRDAETVRATYIATHLTTWLVIVPLALAALATGVLQAIVTPSGLFRHYWIVVKLTVTTLATLLLLVHTRPIDQVAALAASGGLSGAQLWGIRLQMIGDASAAIAVLIAMTAVSVYKPWGLTSYGLRQQAARTRSGPAARQLPVRAPAMSGKDVLMAIGIGLAAIVLLHLLGSGFHAH